MGQKMLTEHWVTEEVVTALLGLDGQIQAEPDRAWPEFLGKLEEVVRTD